MNQPIKPGGILALRAMLKKLLPQSLLMHLQAFDHYFNGEIEIKLLDQLCDPTRMAIDAGANIGTYTYFLRKHAKKITAYEPNPILSARLQDLYPDILVRPVALSDTPGKVILKVPLNSAGNVQHELASISQAFEGATVDYPVECVTIDSENLIDVGFIKIDVEQHEIAVLKGCLNTIKRFRPVIMTEVSPLLYDSELPTEFQFLTDCEYCGWFRFAGNWLKLANYKTEIHGNKINFGNSAAFIGGNILFFPHEHKLAQTGPRL